MLKYAVSRLIQFPIILAVIYITTVSLVWIAPGDPFSAASEKNSPERVQQLKEQYHADTYLNFVTYYGTRAMIGDFGPSLTRRGYEVSEIIGNALPVSLAIGTLAIVFASFGGVFIGTLAAVRQNGVIDYLSLGIALVGVSVPSFVVATTLLGAFAFSDTFGFLPLGGWPSGENRGYGNLDAYAWGPAWLAATFDYLKHMLLPAAALSLLPMAYIVRLTRVSMIDVLSSDYVRTARAKGLSKSKVVFKHCLRNAFLPVLSFLGPATANVLVGSFVVEKIFKLPGLGTFFIESVQSRDQPMILGTVIVFSVRLLFLNLIVDLLYGVIDPRIAVSEGGSK